MAVKNALQQMTRDVPAVKSGKSALLTGITAKMVATWQSFFGEGLPSARY